MRVEINHYFCFYDRFISEGFIYKFKYPSDNKDNIDFLTNSIINFNIVFLLKKDEQIYHIKRVPCPHCCYLCSSQIEFCPKCGEPIKTRDKPTSNKKNKGIMDIEFSEEDYLKILEIEVGKNIPEVKEIAPNQLGYLQNNNKVIGISLPNCKLKSLPPLTIPLHSLKFLYLSHNLIHRFPKELAFMPSLKDLWLDHNQIEVLPAHFGEFSSLLILNLNSNRINCLPMPIEGFKFLKKLFLRRNKLKALPKEFALFSCLEVLDLRLNQLNEFPNPVCAISSLKALNLSANDLLEIPKEICNLVNLEVLNLDNNKLKNIPSSLGNLNNLKKLNVKANFWLDIPKEVLDLAKKGLKINQ